MTPREPFNACSHLIGAGLALIGGVVTAIQASGPWIQFAVAVYTISITTMLGSSGVYHASHNGVEKLRRFDHFAIALAIWGTYVPICAKIWPSPGGWMLVVETALLIYLAFESVAKRRILWLRLASYVVMGWLALAALPQLMSQFGPVAVQLVVAGGLIYTFGLVVFASKKPNPWPETIGFHGLWHIFVLAGAACHLFAVRVMVLGRAF